MRQEEQSMDQSQLKVAERIIVSGGRRLSGTVRIDGAKNAVLPIIAASLLGSSPTTLRDVPWLDDVATACDVSRHLGASVARSGTDLTIDPRDVSDREAPYELVRRMRASFLMMGPMLARCGRARIALPGGCAIGTRPIDLHLKGFEAMGAHVLIGHGQVDATCQEMHGARVYLDFPSVGATENIMAAATLANGTTIIENAAEEPEIVDLANFLSNMGARIFGAGTPVIRIEGVDQLGGCAYTVIPDRIEAGTFMAAAAATGGEVLLENVVSEHLKPVIAKLTEAGDEIHEQGEDGAGRLHVVAPPRPRAIDIKTLPYPGFPTDMQAQAMAMLSVAEGTSIVTETVFENRFMHVDELKRMGAAIKIEGRSAIIRGQTRLQGARVKASDLRAGAALVIAALVADGTSEILGVEHIDRGYVNLEGKLTGLGADIRRAPAQV
jgi:UDP-N-acetylglucosamine 1-carboxyvinyltransferase